MMMMDCLPPALLEVCVLVGASSEKLQEACQVIQKTGSLECAQLEPEVLHVLAPPFVSKTKTLESGGRKRRSFQNKREQPSSGAATTHEGEDASEGSEDVTVPKDIDLLALPQLCFPGGLEVTSEEKTEQFHFLVLTDIFGNKTHGVVMQYYRSILGGMSSNQNRAGSSIFSKLFSAYSFCVISKYAYFTALKDCLSCLLIQLRTCRLADMEEKAKDFATKLTLVPIPPPGQLHLMFTLHPLTVTLPSREDKDRPLIDLDLHLPFLCFRPQQLLQVLSCLLQEQRVVLFSANWARLTLIAESLLIFLKPLLWQHPYVPVLARGMLDFLMAPTAFLMGCHLSHFAEVAAETENLILVNIDDGSVYSSSLDVPGIPPAAADCFTYRCQSLQMHFDLDQCHSATCTSIDELREQRRAWQHELNRDIQTIALELIVNIFRDISNHLNYEHRVFHSEEFLKSRQPNEQLFYKKVLDTHIFHSFLRERLDKKTDNFARMELSTRSDKHRRTSLAEVPRRPNMQEIQAKRKSSISENRLSNKLGMSFFNLGDNAISVEKNLLFSRMSSTCDSALKSPPKPVKVLKLPDFPVILSSVFVQKYYGELIQQFGKAIYSVQTEDSALVARFYYLRGLINTVCSRRLDALSDFQTLYKTDMTLFPTHLVTWLVDSLHHNERQQALERPELKRLLLKVETDNEKPLIQTNYRIKKFALPKKPLNQDEFARCVQECGIVKDVPTIHRLFDALTGGHPIQVVDPEVFQRFYTFWKEMEAEAQDVNLPSEVLTKLDNSECVYKLSSSVKTSRGVGKIAMTQKRLILLTDGKPGFLEITKFRDIQEVKVALAPFLRGRVSSLRVQSSSRPEVFEANLKTETKLWNLVVREMWAGREMADQHKDPEYMTQALTNVLLMDVVVGCLQTRASIPAASKLAHFDQIKNEALTVVPDTLKHKINPSLGLSEPLTVHVLLYTPGQLSFNSSQSEMHPKLWVALSGGRVVVFDAASWLILQDNIQVGESQVTCMMGLVQDQVWIGSQDSVIYIIDTRSMFCNKQLTEHRDEVTGLSVDSRDHSSSQHMYSCSYDGTILQWDLTSLTVKKRFDSTCDRLLSIQMCDNTLWCCYIDGIVELKKSGIQHRRIALPGDLQRTPSHFSCFVVIPERGQLWAGCSDSEELFLWLTNNLKNLCKRISLPNSSGITCMIRVKNQIWVGCHGQNDIGGQLFVVDLDSLTVEKELLAHSDSIQTLCSAEDRYILSGSACRDGKIAIWTVE